MANGNGTEEPGFRITLATVYSAVTNLEKETNNLRVDVKLMDSRINSVLKENNDLREDNTKLSDRVDKLQSRFNGVLIGIGTGLLFGIPAFVQLVLK